MEQVLYAQFVKLRQKGLKFIAGNKNENKDILKFQGLSVRSQRRFDLDFDCNEGNFRTREPGFCKKLFRAMTIHKI